MRDTNDLLDELDIVVVESNIPVIEGGTSSVTLPTDTSGQTFWPTVTPSVSVTIDTSHTQTLN